MILVTRRLPGGQSVGAPIRDSTGNVVATKSISLPIFELPKSRIEPAAKVVREAAREVSRELGWQDTKE